MSIWPYGARYWSQAALAPIPSDGLNELQDRLWTMFGGMFGGSRPIGIVHDMLGYETWAKGSPPPKWKETVTTGGGGGSPGVVAVGTYLQLETDDGAGDSCRLVTGMQFAKRSSGGWLGARFSIKYGIPSGGAASSRSDVIGFYDDTGGTTCFIGVTQAGGGANWFLVVDDDTNSKSADLGVAPAVGTPQWIDVAVIGVGQVAAQVEGGSVVVMTVGAGGEPVELDDATWIAAMKWKAQVATSTSAARIADIKGGIFIADGRSLE